jgi:FAD-linked oxidoreductase
MIARRHLLRAGTAAALAGTAGLATAPLAGCGQPPAAPPEPPPAPGEWRNWSGIERCRPAVQAAPADEAELASLLREGSGAIRCAGAGHSFTGLVPTDGTLLSLDRLSGIVTADAAANRVTVRAGTRIGVLARALDALGLALDNQPDIDVQTLAGAFSTGTHGTGRTLAALHAHVTRLRLVTPQGEVIDASRTERPEVFDAARVSLGSLGVITQYELDVRPRFLLRRRVWLETTEKLLDEAPALAAQHRHFELYVLPFTGYSAAISHDEVPAQSVSHAAAADEQVLDDLRKLRDTLGRFPALRRWVAQRLIGGHAPEESVDRSFRLLSTVRPTRFNESEYHVPAAHGIACLRQAIATIERRNDAFFPMEFRWIRGDDAWLSPFEGGDRNSIAVHALHGEPHDYLVKDLGPVFRQHGGRPHWGKLHDLDAATLSTLYPRWRDFQAVRRELDPRGRLLNAATRRLFGEASA